MRIVHNMLIMALDGARMSLFRNKGSVQEPSLELLIENEQKTPSTAELGDDHPGRSFQSSGRIGGAYEATDLHQQAEDEFTLEMAELLSFHMSDEDHRAILIAPPKVLGIMRKHLRTEIRTRLAAEIAKDYCGRNATDLATLLDDYELNPKEDQPPLYP
jgi:protein required for attachment to host cells